MANQVQDATRTPVSGVSAALAFVGRNEGREASLQEKSSVQADLMAGYSKKLQVDLQMMGLNVKKHEDNIELLKAEMNKIDESILDKQASTNVHQNEEKRTAQLLRHERSAAGLLCYLNKRYGTTDIQLTKDVLGIVANLGTVNDDNLSRLLSEYLGLDNMMAIVCHTHEGVLALETYEKDGTMDKNSGIHGLAASIGRSLEGRFNVMCLENLRPFVGDIVANDPQRSLNLLKPKLQNGECPHGFVGFAVNMINVDSTNRRWLTPAGYGLRDTLFYNLFSRLQVYKTRKDMLQALSCITDGAISLDGGIVNSGGIFSFGNGSGLSVTFPVSPGASDLHGGYAETDNEIKKMKWMRGTIVGDLQRERHVLDLAKASYERKKEELIKSLADSSPFLGQSPAAQQSTPR